MVRLRRWAVRRAGPMKGFYDGFERLLVALDPVLAKIGYDRLERPVAVVERGVKGALFDCRMCGQCILGSTGLSCPMNCPKSLRNGPCGGVRPDGRCEVKPEMTCVWVLAVDGSRRMPSGDKIEDLQPPLDHRLWGHSAWLGLLRRLRAGKRSTADTPVASPGATRTTRDAGAAPTIGQRAA